MTKDDLRYGAYTVILKEELVPAMGCTEPIAIAYAAAKAAEILGTRPDKCRLELSGSIIKNVKSVIVPHTGRRKGIEIALAAGITAGDPEAGLEVLSGISPDRHPEILAYAAATSMEIVPSKNGKMFYIDLTVFAGRDRARVVIADEHTNIVLTERNGEVLPLTGSGSGGEETAAADRTLLTVDGIWDYVQSVDLKDVEKIIERQIRYNSALSDEGFRNPWGAQIGRVLREEAKGDVRILARAAAAAGSDARMNGCELPAIIVSGSGNQGLTVTMPVLVYAEHLGSDRETLLRALVLADLITVHERYGMGSVSAFCGATCAGVGAGCGVAYLQGAGYDAVCHTIVNGLAVLSGMICDGAKSSCAAKIAAAVDAGIMGYTMYCHGQQFLGGDGIVKKGVENSINSVCEVAREGMRVTNDHILRIMLDK